MVTVNVKDEAGQPIEGAGCQFIHASYPGDWGYTDSYGNWSTFNIVPTSDWYLIVAHPQYLQHEEYYNILSEDVLISVVLTLKPTLFEIIVNALDGLQTPVSGTTVQVSRQGGGYDQTKTSTGAPLVFEDVPYGIYDIYASKAGYESGELLGQSIWDTAEFNIQIYRTFEVNVTAATGGSTDKDGVNPVLQGDTFTITASPWPTYYLEEWIVNGQVINALSKETLILEQINQNYVISPVFLEIPPGPFYLSLIARGKGKLTPNIGVETGLGTGVYVISEVSDVTVTADTEPLLWYEDGIVVQEGGTTYIVSMTRSKIVQATFEKIPYDPLVIVGVVILTAAFAGAIILKNKR